MSVALGDTARDVDRDVDVVVIGGGIAGLVVAHDLARAGRSVIVCEASDRVGGLLRRGTVAGIDIDLGAESFATRTDAVATLVADAGLDLELVAPRPGGAHLVVATAEGPVRAPLPKRTILGIPADPLAPDVALIIGTDAAVRAAQERTLPVGREVGTDDGGGVEPSLFDLVAQRCGPIVAARLVDPLCRSVYSRPAASARLSELHPPLWRAFLEHGSLTAAADALASPARAGAAVGGIAGGMWRLPEELARVAELAGAQIRTATPVEAIAGDAEHRFVVRTATGQLQARAVVLAVGPDAGDRLLGLGDPVSTAAESARVRVVAAAIDHAGLDAFPVGSGVIVDPALPTAAKALTHTSAKWPWVRTAAPDVHLVRLSARDARADALVTAADVAREVTLLTGVEIQASDVRDVVVQEWPDAVATDPREGKAEDQSDGALALRGIHRVGAAVAGTGLASVIPHAHALAAALAASLSSRTSVTTRSTP